MPADALRHIVLLFLEASLIAGCLLVLFRLRDRYGLALLCVTLGAFQHLQTQLAATLYVEVWPSVFVSPGSAVLFTATLFVTLLVYIREDATAARSLIVGVVVANVTLTVVMLLAQQHIAASALSDGSSIYAIYNVKTLLIGTAILCVDVVLIIVLYEFFFRLFRRSLLLRVMLAMLGVIAIDTVMFVTSNFYGEPQLAQLLKSGIIGKGAAAIYYSLLMVAYLRLVPAAGSTADDEPHHIRDIFHILTYRQRYEILKDELSRDSMTGLFNRGFFDRNLPQEVERAHRLQHSLTLMLVDLDNFKIINDKYGHQAGDDIILLLAESMQELFRVADIACRYGGEEFAVILPDSTQKTSFLAAHRLRRRLREKCAAGEVAVPLSMITFTAGIASCPEDATSAQELLRIADERLYAGKHAGRDRVVTADRPAMAEV